MSADLATYFRDRLASETSEDGRESLKKALINALIGRMADARGLPFPLPENSPPLPELDAAALPLWLPGTLHSTLLAERHAQGSYYTPLANARAISLQALKAINPLPSLPRIIDPACGGGNFLLAAAEVLHEQIRAEEDSLPELAIRQRVTAQLFGIDLDPEAAQLARFTLWLWLADPACPPDHFNAQIITADALLDDVAVAHLAPPFDIVLGNPPFASVFTRAAESEMDAAIRSRYQTARGSYDLAVPFVELTYNLLRAGGVAALILPNKLFAASYGAELRAFIGKHATILSLTHAEESLSFDAAVYPSVLLFRREEPAADHQIALDGSSGRQRSAQADLRAIPGAPWSVLFSKDWQELRSCYDGSIPLGEAAAISAGLTVAEGYDLRDRIMESPMPSPPLNTFMTLTSGLIGRYETRWGKSQAYILKRRFQRPVIPMAAVPERRREQSHDAKIILSGLALRPEAFLDPGLSQACVATLIITDAIWPLSALCAYLNSGVIARVYRALYGGLALSGGYLRFGKRELGSLPFPPVSAEDPRISQLSTLHRSMTRVEDAREAARLETTIDSLVSDLLGLMAGKE